MGFSLVEMAIVLVILGLLLGGAMALIGPQREVQNVKDTEAEILRIQDALIAFAQSSPTGSLPCPDNTHPPTGIAPNVAAPGFNCPQDEGWLPFATLGVGAEDAWGNRFRYRIVTLYGHATPATTVPIYNLGTPLAPAQTLNVCSLPAIAAGCPVGATVATNVVAIIVSHGRNGYGSRNQQDVFQTQPVAASSHERENTNGRTNTDAGMVNTNAGRAFVSHEPRTAGTLGGEFDDIVGWIPQGLFHSKMLAAGKLP